MSDIRFNRWLHQSGTGGVSQDSSGNIGIGTTVPTEALDVRGNLSVSDTITATTGTFSGNISAVDASYTGNVSIGGTLTYEDVANIDAVGIVTARSDVHVGAGLSVVGVSTLGNTVVGGATTELIVGGDARITGILTIGTSSLTLDGTNNNITVGAGITIAGNTGIISATGGINAKLLGTPELAAISSSISDTAVDVFVYDTRKDSDGGAWRKRTQHTSWYNETLNTATRGSRREFPAVAVIVISNDTAGLTIYDGDDPDLPMWMVFNETSGQSIWQGTDRSSVAALNGIIVVGQLATIPLPIIGFVADEMYNRRTDTTKYNSSNIAGRNTGGSSLTGYFNQGLVNATANDVAMTVLPNAPIDDATGLPVPTIAVATDGGVSVIKDDGTVVDIIDSNSGYRKNLQVKFTTDNKVVYTETSAASEYGWMYIHEIPSSDETITINTKDTALGWYDTRTQPYMQNILGVTIDASINVDRNVGLNVGVGTIIPNIVTGNNHIFVAPAENSGITIIEENRSSTNSGLVAYATTSYNTGWMHGNIKGAFLSDTDTTSIGTELIQNGTFTSTTEGWSNHPQYANTALSIDSSRLKVYGGAAQQQITTVVGQQYIVQYTLDTSAGYLGGVYVGTTSTGTSSYSYFSTGSQNSGTYYYYFTATTTTAWISLYAWNAGTEYVFYDNVSIKAVEEDRSVNNKGLQPFGTVTKSPVAGSGATAAELVAYGPFSSSNYLYQPYNTDFDFGTGDFSIMFWVKSTSTGYVFWRNDTTSAPYWDIYVQETSNLRFRLGTTQENITSGVDTTQWTFGCFTRSGSTASVYINGKLSSTFTESSDITNADAPLYIGRRVGSSSELTAGYVSLMRISGSAPSPEQIKKIYEDEKVLFQENAACTLHGSSDAVTALAYDEVTQRLHVGTSSGRSDFQGLRRINNTTTAVTTAISASNGLVAEQ